MLPGRGIGYGCIQAGHEVGHEVAHGFAVGFLGRVDFFVGQGPERFGELDFDRGVIEFDDDPSVGLTEPFDIGAIGPDARWWCVVVGVEPFGEVYGGHADFTGCSEFAADAVLQGCEAFEGGGPGCGVFQGEQAAGEVWQCVAFQVQPEWFISSEEPYGSCDAVTDAIVDHESTHLFVYTPSHTN